MLISDTNRLLGAALSSLLLAVCLPMGSKVGWGPSPWGLAWNHLVNKVLSRWMEEDAQMRKLRLEEGRELAGLSSPQLEDRHTLSSPCASDSSALFPRGKAELAVEWGGGSRMLVLLHSEGSSGAWCRWTAWMCSVRRTLPIGLALRWKVRNEALRLSWTVPFQLATPHSRGCLGPQALSPGWVLPTGSVWPPPPIEPLPRKAAKTGGS